MYKSGRGDWIKNREGASKKHKVQRETSTEEIHEPFHLPSFQSADIAQLSQAMMTISKSISNTGMPGIVAGEEWTAPLRSAGLVTTPGGVSIESNLTEGSGSAGVEGPGFTVGERTRRENCGSRDGSVDRTERSSRQRVPREELPPTPLQFVEQQSYPVGTSGKLPSHESLRNIQELPHGQFLPLFYPSIELLIGTISGVKAADKAILRFEMNTKNWIKSVLIFIAEARTSTGNFSFSSSIPHIIYWLSNDTTPKLCSTRRQSKRL
jgi:hypothetical protein